MGIEQLQSLVSPYEIDLISKNDSEQRRVCYHHLHCRLPLLSGHTTWLRILRCSCRALCSPFTGLSTLFLIYFLNLFSLAFPNWQQEYSTLNMIIKDVEIEDV